MSVGASEATVKAELSATFQATSYVVSALWAQLHIGDPGDAGTANVAAESTRKNVSSCFGTPPALAFAGAVQIANDATVGPWTAVTATEAYSHMTLWTASTSGTFVGSATVSGGSVTAGDDWDAPAGSVVITKPCAS